MTPQIIRTVKELKTFDRQTLVIDSDDKLWLVDYALFSNHLTGEIDCHHVFSKSLPLAVVATGEQVRAARKALEDAT